MPLLVGDHEREHAAHELQRHYREGRLSTDELAQRLETALRARNAVQLRSALNELPGRARRAILERCARLCDCRLAPSGMPPSSAGTAALWVFWSIGMLVAFVAWLAANGRSLAALVVFPLLWFGASWLLWSGSKRRRSRR